MTDHDQPGRLSREQLIERGATGDIHTVLAVFPDFYGRLMGKRIPGRFFVRHGDGCGPRVFVCELGTRLR